MTTDKNFKRLVRARMTATGERYTAAHDALVADTPERVRQVLTDFERVGIDGPGRSENEHLLAEALRLLGPVGEKPSADLVHVAHRLFRMQWDFPARVQLFEKYLSQPLPVEEEAWARWELVDSMAVIGASNRDTTWCERAVKAQRELSAWVEATMPSTYLPWVWHDSTMLACWSLLERSDEWVEHVEPVIAGARPVPENRTDRFELLNSATYAYNALGMKERARAVADVMKQLLAEDPEWHDRQWAEDRLHKQCIDFALREKDFLEARTAAEAYVEWAASQDPQLHPHGDITALFLWSGDYPTAMHYGELAVAREAAGHTFVWYAAAVMGATGDLTRVADILREARKRLPAGEVEVAFQNQAEFADHLDDPQLREAIKP